MAARLPNNEGRIIARRRWSAPQVAKSVSKIDTLSARRHTMPHAPAQSEIPKIGLGDRGPGWRQRSPIRDAEARRHPTNAGIPRGFPRTPADNGGDRTGWLGREDSNSRIQRHAGPLAQAFTATVGRSAPYSLQKGLDFRCEWSVSVAVPIRAAWPYLDPAPLAMPPLWGFGGDGARRRRN